MYRHYKADMNIIEKYNANRQFLKNGDIILFRGDDTIDHLIQLFDESYFNHIGIVWKCDDRFLICDATAGRGINIDWLSTRMKQEVDFCTLRVDKMQVFIDNGVSKALLLSDENWGYNYKFILQIAIKKLTGIDFKGLSNKNAMICSMFVKEYVQWLGIEEYKTDNLCTPQDFIRKMTNNLFRVIK